MDNPRMCSPKERESILKRDGYKCRYCGSEKFPFHIDHVYPYSLGGITKVSNLVTSCSDCNHYKHDSVGMWPKPIGYFDLVPEKTHISYIGLALVVFSLTFLYNSVDIILNFPEFVLFSRFLGFLGIISGLFGVGFLINGK